MVLTRAETADRRAALLAALISFVLPAAAFAGVTLSDVKGTARVRRPNTVSWNEVPANYVLNAGDEVKTDRSSRVTLQFDDGSRVELGPNSSYLLEEERSGMSSMTLSFGKLRAWVTKASTRRFSVRTPTAVCSVRGTEFGVDVGQDGRTSVQLFEGLLGVQDNRGNEVLLNPGDSVNVDQRGINKEGAGSEKKQETKSDERGAIKREVGLEMSKEQVLAAAAEELKAAEYQAGKAIVDVHGNRVRIESYIMRPQPTSFKLVVLNEREARFDYMYYLANFGQTLPDDLTQATRQTFGCLGPCSYTLLDTDVGLSNTIDSYRLTRTFGASQLNGAGAPTFIVQPDGTWYAVQAGDQIWWQPVATENVFLNGTNFAAAAAAASSTNCSQDNGPGLGCNFTSDTLLHTSRFFGSANGNWFQFENFAMDDDGKVLERKDFPTGSTALAKNARTEWYNKNNFEFIITSSAFGGRKIDLAVDPRAFMAAGLLNP